MQPVDPGRPVRIDLLAYGQVQRQMKKRILCPTLRQVLGLDRQTVGFQERVILGMFRDQLGDLCLERLEGLTAAVFSPCIDIDAAQVGASLLVKERHALSLAASA